MVLASFRSVAFDLASNISIERSVDEEKVDKVNKMIFETSSK